MIHTAMQAWLAGFLGLAVVTLSAVVSGALNYCWGYNAGQRDTTPTKTAPPAPRRRPASPFDRMPELGPWPEPRTDVISHRSIRHPLDGAPTEQMAAAVGEAQHRMLTTPTEPMPEVEESVTMWEARTRFDMDGFIRDRIEAPSNEAQHIIQARQ